MLTSAETIRDYYDDMVPGFLSGYVYGNNRIASALRFVLEWTPRDARAILDAGCGIGESTDALKRHRPGAFVLGIDAHARLISLARTLFDGDGPVFDVMDMTRANPSGAPFDVIVLMDAYEHIAGQDRTVLHATINRLLAPNGRVLLTVPSPSYQHFLRNERPHDVQPIDEDVSIDDLRRLAIDVGGTLVHVAEASIWRSNDYLHAVIARDAATPDTRGIAATTDRPAREARVRSRLRMRISREGAMLPVAGELKVCIAQPNCDSYSERLIRDQLERLPADVTMICDGWFPRRLWNGERLMPRPLVAARRIARAAGSASLVDRLSTLGLSRYLRDQGIDVMLANYGPVGYAVMDACRRASVPLVVQFHGFDAHHQPTIDDYRDRYRRLFDHAAAVIAVSRDMAEQLVTLGASRDKVHYNPGGVDCSRFNGADPETASPRFVFVGRFVNKKAPHLTLRAFQRVHAACPGATLVMIGDGDLLESSRHLARELNIAAAVDFRGAVDRRDVRTALRSARAFVMHSLQHSDGDAEGTPIALLEAAATGLPVIATRHAGIADVVVDGAMGYLVEERDVDAMAARIIDIAEHPQLAARMGARARAHVAANYSIEHNIARLWRIITAAAHSR